METLRPTLEVQLMSSTGLLTSQEEGPDEWEVISHRATPPV